MYTNAPSRTAWLEVSDLIAANGLYVQYGSGTSCPAGWLSFDASPTLRLQRLSLLGGLFRRGKTVFPQDVRYGDIVKGLPIADGSADGIYASHVLEHLCGTDFWIALKNTHRLLKPNGIFRLVIPDLEGRARKYLEKLECGEPEASSWFMRTTGLGAENRSRGLEGIARTVFGNSSHLWMWDERSMAAALQKVGFVGVRRCRFNDCADSNFCLVEESSRFYDQLESLEECAMEAHKPS